MAKKLNSGNFSTEQLNQFVARIERIDEEIKASNDDKKEIYAEVKAHGFDVKVLKGVIKLRRMDQADLAEFDELTLIYMEALGMATRDYRLGRDQANVTITVGTDAATRAGAGDDAVTQIAAQVQQLAATDPQGAQAIAETVKGLANGTIQPDEIEDILGEAGTQGAPPPTDQQAPQPADDNVLDEILG